MALNVPAWLFANAFTKETADEFGAVKGAPCTVGNVSYDADGNTVVELVWTNSAGVKKTTEMTVKAGKGIKSVVIDTNEHLILTMTDNTTIDAGEIPKPDLSDYAKKEDIPTKVEDLEDASDYAKKSEIPEGSVVDDDFSETSKNPVQNKVVTAELKKKIDAEDGKGLSSNDYDDASKAKVDAIPADPKYTDTVYDDTEIKEAIDNKVDSEEGKSLVSNTDIEQININKEAIDVLNGDAETEGSVDKKLADAIALLNKLEKKVLDHVPTVEEAKDNVLYLVETDTAGTYNQYMLIDGAIASLGNTDIDLDGYAKTEDVVLLQQAIIDKGKVLVVGEDGKVKLETLTIPTTVAELEDADDYAKTDDVVAKAQGTEFVGKVLMVNEEGNIEPSDIEIESAAWTGTTEAFESVDKSTLIDGQQINFTDDYESIDYATKEYVDDSLGELINDQSTGTETTWSSSKINSAINSLGLKGDAPANANSAITPGVYFINRSDDAYPTRQGYLIVSRPRNDYNCILQEVYNFSATTMYSRGCWFNTWYDWQEIATMDKVGETVDISSRFTILAPSNVIRLKAVKCGKTVSFTCTVRYYTDQLAIVSIPTDLRPGCEYFALAPFYWNGQDAGTATTAFISSGQLQVRCDTNPTGANGTEISGTWIIP